MNPKELFIDPSGEKELFRCQDCGNWTRQIWGFVETTNNGAREAYAVYYMRWTDNRRDHGITAALSIGGWGSSTRKKILIGMAGEVGDEGPMFRFIDAAKTPWGAMQTKEVPELGEPLTAREVLAGPLAREAMVVMAALESTDERYQRFVRPNG